MKKGICLILCIILLTGLVPVRSSAVYGEPVDGIWASIALTGGANKVLFSADSEIENQILYPDDTTSAQYILPEGAVYDAASNTLNLTDFNEPTANLVLTMMGTDFRIRLAGSSRLASIRSESKGRGGSITFCGDGELELSSSETAVLVHADGAADFVRIEPQLRLTVSSPAGSAICVLDTALSDGAILFDTCDPQVTAVADSTVIGDVMTTGGKTVELCRLPGQEGLYGIEAEIAFGSETEQFVYNVYTLGEKNADGLYPEGEEIAHNTEDISAYQPARTPYSWTIAGLSDGSPASRVRFAYFAVRAQNPGEGGMLSVSQTEVARGGSVEVRTVPRDGYKLASLTVNGTPVSPANGSYVIAGITADQTVAAVFAAATPENIEVTAPEVTDFKVPANGADPFVSEPFSAAVTDGAGDPVGAEVLWSIEPQTEGVSIGSDGRVTVTNAAKSAVSEGSLSFTVTASAEGTELTDANRTFTVSLSERRAAAVHLTRSGEALGDSDTILIPPAGETASQQYAATVTDQYGDLREEEIVWSAGDWPVGVRRDGDTLTVSDSCRDGSTLAVTAACASDSTVSASFTVTFAERREELLRGAEPVRAAEPTVTWPTVTLAENPVYGLTWAQLVTLGSDGSAVRGEEPVEGSFAIDKDGAALPNISDSFKIVFTYLDGEESKTVESDERAVSLARKQLDPAMITLSPSEMPYTGTAREPAVSLRDGSRALILGTDYSVNGYADNISIGDATVTVAGLGNYEGNATKTFKITPIPGSSVSSSVTSRKPEDESAAPTIVLKYGDSTLAEGTDYDLALQYDIPAQTGTATIAFKGIYSGTRILSFDLPNYLITVGAGSNWKKSYTAVLAFKANGALGKFTELTVDGKTVPTSYYTAESGSTIIKIKPDYLKSLSAGKHIVGVAYKDGKALAIFTIIDADRRGVPTGDGNNAAAWIVLLAASLIAFGALTFAFVRSGQKKKKKKKNSRQ